MPGQNRSGEKAATRVRVAAVGQESLLARLQISRDKAEEALDKVLQAEAALRELAAQFQGH